MRTTFVVLCAFAALALTAGHDSEVAEFRDWYDEVVPEHSMAPQEFFVEEPVQEESEFDMIMDESKNKGESARVLKHISELYAYAICSHDETDSFKDDHDNADLGLVQFLNQFGKVKYSTPPPPPKANLPDDIQGLPVELPSQATLQPSKKVIVGNPVLEYAQAIKAAEALYPAGFGPYILGELNSAVLAGGKAEILEEFDGAKGSMVRLSYTHIGTTTMPAYLTKFACTVTKYEEWLHKIHKVAGTADAAAATLWLQEGQKTEFLSFFNKEVEKANAIALESNANIETAAATAINHQFHSGGQTGLNAIGALPMAGLKAAEGTKALKVPSHAEMEKAAAEAAKKWVAAQHGDLAKKMAEKVEGAKALKEFNEIILEKKPLPTPAPAPIVPQDGKDGVVCRGAVVASMDHMNDWNNFKSNGLKAGPSDCEWQCTQKHADRCKCFKFSTKNAGSCKLYTQAADKATAEACKMKNSGNVVCGCRDHCTNGACDKHGGTCSCCSWRSPCAGCPKEEIFPL